MAYFFPMTQQEELERLRAWGPSETCHYLGTKVRRFRQEIGMSQSAFAERAGVPLRTYKRFESHGRANLETFIQVLQAMDRAHYLFMLFPQPSRPAAPTFEDKLRSLRLRTMRMKTPD